MLYKHKGVYVVYKGVGRPKFYIEKMPTSKSQST